MLQEFKKFALRGNVVDLAVGVIIGVAFGKIVDSLVSDIIMPIIGRIFGGLDFTNYFIGLTPAASQAPTYDAAKKAGATVGYGTFITALEHGVPQLVVPGKFGNDKFWGPLAWLDRMEEEDGRA